MPKLVNGKMTLSFGEATAPKILAMYGGEVTAGDACTLVLRFPNVLSAASWANTCELQNCAFLSSNRIGSGPSLGDWCFLEVIHDN